MKKFIQYTSLLVLVFTLFSCEKTVYIDLDETEPRLVVDAVIRWQKDTDGAQQLIKLSLTNDFYTNDVLAAKNAIVTITDGSGQVFDFVEVDDTEDYVCTTFVPQANEVYTLEVTYEGEVYTATNTLLTTPDITYVNQETLDNFGEETIQVKYYFQDDATTDDFYLLGVVNPNKILPEFGILDDEFSQGEELFGFYASDETEPGITLYLTVQSITPGFYDYMNKLIPISASSGNPFATPPATLRGNIVNATNEANYALGYFHLAEIDVMEYVVE